MLSKKVTPPSTEAIERFKKECVSMEASGNHGYYGDGPGDDADMRRGITFWGTGRGWQLYKDWRETWAKKYPDVGLPPAPPPKPKPKRIPRSRLEKLVAEYHNYNPNVGHLSYWPDKPCGWHLEMWHSKPAIDHVTGEEYTEWDSNYINLGDNSEIAEYHLRQEIERWKREHGISGQEPSLGGQAERTGQEPMIGGK